MQQKAITFFDLGRQYQIELFHEIITDKKFGESVIEIIDPSHFQVDAFKKLCVIIKKYHEKHEVILDFPHLEIQINIEVSPDDETLRLQLVDTVKEIQNVESSNKNVQEYALKFCRMHAVRNAVNGILTKLNKGIVNDYDEIESTLKHALIFKEVEDPTPVYHNLDAALAIDYRHPVSTSIPAIDEIMRGGLGKKEVALVIAPLGVGKSTWLSIMANAAYRQNQNVLHVFFEDNENDIRRKHVTIASKIPLKDLSSPEWRDIIKGRVKDMEAQTDGKLFLLKLPADGVTLTKIKNVIKKLNASGHKIDMLVLDYIDCVSLENETYQREEWSNEGKIMRRLESLASELDIAVWTAVQGNRGSTSIEVVRVDNMGGSLKKAQIAHFIMSIGKTLEQKESKTATISILKNRFGDDGMIFEQCGFNNDLMSIEIDINKSKSSAAFEDESIEVRRQRAYAQRDNIRPPIIDD